jgi:dTDP-4-dehydrorhamnose reductase
MVGAAPGLEVLLKVDILVLGASGMLGSAVRQVLGPCAGTQSEDPSAPDYLDVLKPWTLPNFPYIINCIGILKSAVKEADSLSLERAIRVNALFPHELAHVAPKSRIIHLSTDGVFSGSLNRPYLETDPTDCPDAYGKTKALGECPAPNVINIRCSIIGRDPHFGKGLLEWVLRSRDGEELSGFEDHLWNGVTTLQFGQLCRGIIVSGAFDRIRLESAVHHFCPNADITKYDLLCAIRDAASRNITIRRTQSGAPITRTLGTIYKQLRAIYPGGDSWPDLLTQTLVCD